METKRLSKVQHYFGSISDYGFALFTAAEVTMWNAFLTDVAALDLKIVSFILAFTSIYEMIYVIFCGAIADKFRINPKKWGRYRGWLYIGTLVVLVANPFKFFSISNQVATAAIICVAFVITNSFYDTTWAANLSLTSILTDDPEENALVFSNRLKYFTAGRMSLSFIGVPLIAFFSRFMSKSMSYTVMNFVIVIPFVITYAWQANMAKKQDPPVANPDDIPASERPSIKGMLNALIKNPPLMILMTSDVARQTATFVVGATATYYFTYVAHRPDLFATYLFVYPLAGLIGSLSSNFIYKYTRSLKKQWILGLSGWGVGLLLAYFTCANPIMFLVFIVFSQVMFGLGCAFDKALYGDTIVYAEWKTGNSARSFIMGLSALPIKIATLIKGVVTSSGLIMIGYVANQEQTAETLIGLQRLVMLVPAIFLFVGAALFLAYPLTEKRIAEMKADIAARK